ncbi:MAG TPA: SIS domain-containing protein [Propionibacteriaceae bacterium]|jgi:phosphoglucose isomerase-like protein|nr:SIS domain-containing protein [Propionibacteriaceae bacterium]
MTVFNDSWLDDQKALVGADSILRRLAEAGARVRRETADSAEPISRLQELPRPRAVIAAGTEARFIRAMLEPVCPVPFVAWPTHGLPGWVGALDLVVVMASESAPAGLIATVHEAVRRGCQLLIACPRPSMISEHAASRSTIVLPTATADPLAAAIVVLHGLHSMQLGPEVYPQQVADAMDKVAEECSPFADVSENPAKDLAMGLADAQPLVWGGSVLAARASRRLAEALRAATGRAALAADADALLPILDSTPTRDPFADPFEDQISVDRRPTLVLLDDGNTESLIRSDHQRLVTAAERNDVRVCPIAHWSGSDVERYAALLQTGMFAAVYLAVGLGRSLER